MKKFRLTKVSDDKFNGFHPNGIDEGYTKEGYMPLKPTVGERFYLGALRTSTVTEVIDATTFKTLNSTYKLEEIDEEV